MELHRHARSIRLHLAARRLDTEFWHLWTCLFGRCCRHDFPVPRCLATANLKAPPGDELGRHRRGRRPCLQEQQSEKSAQAEAGRDRQHSDAHFIHQQTEEQRRCRLVARAGAPRMPLRSPLPTGPEIANGTVPLAIVRRPLPAPCKTAKAMIAPGPSSPRITAPIGCSRAATRAETSGCTIRSAPNSTSRAATCAGPTRAAAAIAVVVLAPAISRRRGRCAAIAPVTNQVAANTKARIAMAHAAPATSPPPPP